MKIVLLGSNGQLGADIVRASRQYPQITITALTRKNVDISHLEQITSVLSAQQFDVLINCTAYNDTRGAETDAQGAMLINAQAVARMAQVCEDKQAKFVHISTDYVFDGTKGSVYVETDTPAPLNVYGASKYLGETLARMHCSQAYIIRTASLFGGDRGTKNFVNSIIKLSKQQEIIEVVDDVMVSPTYTYHLAQAILQLLALQADGAIYHLVNSGESSWYEFAVAVVEHLKLQVSVNQVASSAVFDNITRPKFSCLDNTKALVILGDQCLPSWQDGLVEYLSIYRD